MSGDHKDGVFLSWGERKAEADLLVDTNVLVDLVTIADAVDAAGRYPYLQHAPFIWWRHPKVIYRLQRLASALLFTWQCHKEALTLGLLQDEFEARIIARSKPEQRREWAFVTGQLFTHLLREFVFPRAEFGSLDEVPPGLSGNKADQALLDIAKRDQIPLITNEGWTVRGHFNGKRRSLRFKALSEGVDVMSTWEFAGSRITSLPSAARDFMSAFDEAVPEYFLHRGTVLDGAADAITALREVYERTFELVLQGPA